MPRRTHDFESDNDWPDPENNTVQCSNGKTCFSDATNSIIWTQGHSQQYLRQYGIWRPTSNDNNYVSCGVVTQLSKMRNQYKDEFQNNYGVKLGFMSFFVKACVIGLKNYPAINAEIQGVEIVYKN